MEEMLTGRRSDVPAYVPEPSDDDPVRGAEVARWTQKLLSAAHLNRLDEERKLAAQLRTDRPDLMVARR